MKDIVIIGAGGFARHVQWIINDINKENKQWNLIGFVDENIKNKGLELNGNRVLGDLEDIILDEDRDVYYVCAIGDPIAKKKLVKRAETYDLKPATLIHPSVIMSDLIDIGEGSIICAGTIIAVNSNIGKHVIINIGSTLGHDAKINDYATILPGVNVSGYTVIDESASVGTGSAIIQGLNIGKNSIIGAGSVVIKDIPSNVIAVGVPAKVIKYREEG